MAPTAKAKIWAELFRVRQSEAMALVPTTAILFLFTRIIGATEASFGFIAVFLVWVSYGLSTIVLQVLGSLVAGFFLRRGRAHRLTVMLITTTVLYPLTVIFAQKLLAGTKVAGVGSAVVLLATTLGLSVAFLCHLGRPGNYRRRIFFLPRILVALILISAGLIADYLNCRFLVKQYILWHTTLAWLGASAILVGFSLIADRWAKRRASCAALGFGVILIGLALSFFIPNSLRGFDSASRIESSGREWARALGLISLPAQPKGDLSLIAGRWGNSQSGRRDEIFAKLGIQPPKSIMLITIDALRADRTGFGGYRRNKTTTFLDQLAAESIVYERAYSQASFSLPSIMSMFTGRYPASYNAWRAQNELSLHPNEITLAETLQLQGFRTIGLVAYPSHRMHTSFRDFQRGFDSFYIPPFDRYRRVGPMFEDAALELKRERERKRFQWIHLMEVHGPYPEEVTPFGSRVSDQYDFAVSVVDQALAAFWSEAKSKGWLKDTLVILHADHGEELFDHGGRFHGTEVFEEQIHVPLLFWMEGIPPRSVSEPVELVDLFPTILDALDLPLPGSVHGDSLLPSFVGESPSGLAISIVLNKAIGGKNLVALIDHDHKVIRDIDLGISDYYNLGDDPREKDPSAGADVEARKLDALSLAAERLAFELPTSTVTKSKNINLFPATTGGIVDWTDKDFLAKQLSRPTWRRAVRELWKKRISPPQDLASLLYKDSPATEPKKARGHLLKLITENPRIEYGEILLSVHEASPDSGRRIEILEALGGLVSASKLKASFQRLADSEISDREQAHRLVALSRSGDAEAGRRVLNSWSTWPSATQLETWPILALESSSPFHSAMMVNAMAPPFDQAFSGFGMAAISRREPGKARDLYSALRIRHPQLANFDYNALRLFDGKDLAPVAETALYQMFESSEGEPRVAIMAWLDRIGGVLSQRLDDLHAESYRIVSDPTALKFEVDPGRTQELSQIKSRTSSFRGLSLKIVGNDGVRGQLIEGFINLADGAVDGPKIPARIYVEDSRHALLGLRQVLPAGLLVFRDLKGNTRLTFPSSP